MDIQKIQRLTDTIESKLLQIAGELKIDTMMKQPPSEDVQDEIGEVMRALLDCKHELGLHTNLSIGEDK